MGISHVWWVSAVCVLCTSCNCGSELSPDGGQDSGADVSLRDTWRPFDAGDDAPDAGFDGGPYDAGDDAGDDAGTWPWTSEWNHDPRVLVRDDTPCEPWEPVASPLARELPADSTPRVLWRYRPFMDPMYNPSHARLESLVRQPVISPDGTIWVQGPAITQVSHLNRDGTMRRWYESDAARDPEDPVDRSALGPMAVAPDGTLLITTIWNGGPHSGGNVHRIDPAIDDGDPFSRGTVGGVSLDLGLYTKIAVSPDGMVYISSENRVYATCRGERLMWTLAIYHKPGVEPGWPEGLLVEPDNRLLVYGSFSRFHRITPAGSVESTLMMPEVDPGFLRNMTTNGTTTLLTTYDNTSDVSSSRIIGLGSPGAWTTRFVRPGTLMLAPSGYAYVRPTMSTVVRWAPPASDVEIVNAGRLPTSERSVWFADGSWTGFYYEDGVLTFARRAEVAGTVDARWAVEMTIPPRYASSGYGGVDARIMDEQGVYYQVVGGAMLVALQTDGLPAPNTMCLDRGGCNSHRDRYLRPMPGGSD